MKRLITSTAFLLLATLFPRVAAQQQHGLSYFPLQDVRLLDSPFLQAQQTDLRYLLALEPDRLLAPFLREAGLTPKAPSYTNWENTGLDGHIGGHYLSALSLMYASTGDSLIYQRLNYMLNELHCAQRAVGTGFIGGTPGSRRIWQEIKAGNIRAHGFSLNEAWVPLYNIHKTYAGLRDAYLHAGSKLARQMLIDLTDWMIDITAGLNDEQIEDMLRSEHGGLNETFADVAAMTGEEKYLRLARRFSHRAILDPLLKHEDHLTGMHANTQIPKVIGYQRIADLSQGAEAEAWADASLFFWHTVVDHRSVCIGGNSVREHFHPADNFTPMLTDVQGPETCNTYNMLRLTAAIYARQLSGTGCSSQGATTLQLADYYERALYNHILSSQEPERGGFVYFTPMRAGHYRVYSQPETSMWCCVGSGMENHAKYGEFIYAHRTDSLYVNLFIPSRLTWREQGVELRQQTHFPDSGEVSLHIERTTRKPFTLLLRVPQWAADAGEASLTINGKTQPLRLPAGQGGYVALRRRWKRGDTVVLHLPMQIQPAQIPDGQPHYAFRYGPIVLAAATGTEHLDGLYADDSRGGHISHGEQQPTDRIPQLLGSPAEVATAFRREPGTEIAFAYTGQTSPHTDTPIRLVPFFRLHNTRYAIYFRVALSAEAAAETESERRATALANRTTDLVFPGEQQPESDHAIRQEDSDADIRDGRRFRRARGWFSYRVRPQGATELRLLLRADDTEGLAVQLDEHSLPAPTRTEADETGFVHLTYALPPLPADGVYTLRFLPVGAQQTPALYEVRFLKPNSSYTNQ